MVPLMELWLPILVSAVLVFIASSVIHMLLPYHRTDVGGLSNETEVADALRRSNVPPGAYGIPYAGSMAAMKDPAWVEKRKRGPNVFLTFLQPGAVTMTKPLVLWFVCSLIVSILAAYVASRAVGEASSYLDVFRFAGVTAFLGYAVAQWQESIWWGRPWSTTAKNTIDGLIYALVTAGTFGWLWPS